MDIAAFFSCFSYMFLHDQYIFVERECIGVASICSRLDKIAWINGLLSLVVFRLVEDR
jgi:hypothetical protein